MKNNNSPGSDGFTAEYYKFFWKDLRTYISKAINQIFTYTATTSCLAEIRGYFMSAKRG